MSGRPTEVEIIAMDIEGMAEPQQFRQNRRMLPGALLLLLAIVGSIAAIVFFGKQLHDDREINNIDPNAAGDEFGNNNSIDDGRPSGNDGETSEAVINPTSYPDRST